MPPVNPPDAPPPVSYVYYRQDPCPPSDTGVLATVALILIGVVIALALILIGHLMAGPSRSATPPIVAPCQVCTPKSGSPQPSQGRPMGLIRKGQVPQEGMTVTLTSTSTGQRWTTTTDVNGIYTFTFSSALPNGDYTTSVPGAANWTLANANDHNPHTWNYDSAKTSYDIDFDFN